MNNVGFSTGALAQGDFERALAQMAGKPLSAVELSALRVVELPRLLDSIPLLDLHQYAYIAVHAPSRFTNEGEGRILELLKLFPKNWPIVVHPDAIHDTPKWRALGKQLVLENMDRRKADGRTAEELSRWFDVLPDARLCVDLAHAQQWDTTMTEAYLILTKFQNRICQIHMSELDSASRHYPLSQGSMKAFSEVAGLIPPSAAIIIESRINEADMEAEAEKAKSVIHAPASSKRESAVA
jgi:hypothetical protein